MKLERETVFGQISYKPEFKSFDHDEINQNSPGLDSSNWTGNAKDIGEEAGLIDALDLTATNFDDCSKSVDDLKTCDKSEIEGFVPEKLEFLEKQSDFYTDNRVMEYDFPELTVCYKESSCNTIKVSRISALTRECLPKRRSGPRLVWMRKNSAIICHRMRFKKSNSFNIKRALLRPFLRTLCLLQRNMTSRKIMSFLVTPRSWCRVGKRCMIHQRK